MCTIEVGEAMVCDVALPAVRAAVALDAGTVVREELVPGQGTRLQLVEGDLGTFVARVRAAVAEVNR